MGVWVGGKGVGVKDGIGVRVAVGVKVGICGVSVATLVIVGVGVTDRGKIWQACKITSRGRRMRRRVL